MAALCASAPRLMARAGERRSALHAALRRCLVFVLCVATALAPAPGPPATAPPPAPVAAVNWASSATYGATAYASNTGHWVRPSRAARTCHAKAQL